MDNDFSGGKRYPACDKLGPVPSKPPHRWNATINSVTTWTLLFVHLAGTEAQCIGHYRLIFSLLRMTHATNLQKFALEVSWKVALEAITINGILVDAHVAVSHPKYKHPYSVRTESWILEKVLKFVQQFSRPGKSLEKWQEVLSVFKSYNKCFTSDFFFVLVKSYSISSIHLHCIVKNLCSCVF